MLLRVLVLVERRLVRPTAGPLSCCTYAEVVGGMCFAGPPLCVWHLIVLRGLTALLPLQGCILAIS